jgi:hypothetical protein
VDDRTEADSLLQGVKGFFLLIIAIWIDQKAPENSGTIAFISKVMHHYVGSW